MLHARMKRTIRLFGGAVLALSCVCCSRPQWNVEPRLALPDAKPPPNPPDVIIDQGKRRELVLEETWSTELWVIAASAQGGQLPIRRADLGRGGAETAVKIEGPATMEVRRVLYNGAGDLSLPVCVTRPDAPCQVSLTPGSWRLGLYLPREPLREVLGGHGFILAIDDRPVRLQITSPERRRWTAGTALWAGLGILPTLLGATLIAVGPTVERSRRRADFTAGGVLLAAGGVGLVLGVALSVGASDGKIVVEPGVKSAGSTPAPAPAPAPTQGGLW